MEAGEIVTTLNQAIKGHEVEIQKLVKLRNAAADLPGKLRELEDYQENLSALHAKLEAKKAELAAYSRNVDHQKELLDKELSEARQYTATQKSLLTKEIQDATEEAKEAIRLHEAAMDELDKELAVAKKSAEDVLAGIREEIGREQERLENIKRAAESLKRM